MKYFCLFLSLLWIVTGCEKEPHHALGTLEWDRVNGRAVASEVIVEIYVQEGSLVDVGTPLLRLDDRKQLARIEELEAKLLQTGWQLKELETGPRPESIAEARSRLAAAQATFEAATLTFERQKILRKDDLTSEEKLDRARNEFLNAQARVEELQQSLNELLAGTRIERIEQARAQVASLEAQLEQARLRLGEYTVTATRLGRLDSLAFKLGDKPPLHAVVSTLLAGQAPWARIYVPEPWRSRVQSGHTYRVKIDGQEGAFTARLRTISSDATFTPYYALTEKDRSRLTYVAEFDLIEAQAKKLTAGTPVQLFLEDR